MTWKPGRFRALQELIDLVLRWVSSALNEASRGFRAVRGFRDMSRLVAALAHRVRPTSEVCLKVS